jgi:chromosome segregation ATPase
MESALNTAKTRIQQMETSLNRFEREHEKLVTEITEVSERERNTQARAQVQLEALQARASMAEKLLANTRQQLAQRNEEARASEREVMEAKRARSAAETLRREVEALVKTHEAHIRELETSRSGLAERSTTLAETLKSRELQLAEADEQRRSAAEQIARLENEIRSGRLTYEKRIDELLAMLDRERLDRQVVEGALDTTRRERAALQHEVYKMRRMQRATPADEPSEAEAEPPRSGRHIDAA